MHRKEKGADFTPNKKSKITMSSFHEIGGVTNDWLDVLRYYLGSFELKKEFILPEAPNTTYMVYYNEMNPKETGFDSEYQVVVTKGKRKPISYNAFEYVRNLKLLSRKETTRLIDKDLNLGLFH